MQCKWILVIAALISLMAGYNLGDYRARRLAYNNFGLLSVHGWNSNCSRRKMQRSTPT